ncbi:MAG: M1 family metallopeptidase [Kofleriaceae bacterium]|nr:M1 family metallopeptidase [Myxococcales bacterium]MCB9564765.1 M1 family metallopeptidase [Kofleriaceae bacterium]MCB9572814.1 M1 family metallopeptidase [Kofleriaceae bacterium]
MRPRVLHALLMISAAACSGAPGAPATPAPPHTTDAPAVAELQPTPAPTPPTLRLPGDVRPVRMALDLTIVPTAATLSGHLRADAEVVTSTRVVWLNGNGLTLEHASVAGHDATVIPGNDDFVGLDAGTALVPGPVTIDVDFTAPIDHTKSQGVYAEAEGNDTYAYTFFEPIDARRAFPCFDEPAAKVPWQLSFHVPSDHVALGNAPVTAEHDDGDGMKTVELAETPPLPSYLVAFVVGPFELVDGGTAGRAATPIRFVIPKGRAAELRWAKEVTPKVVAALEDYFDMDYPYGKLDVAVVPRFWGTMEHPGLVAMGQPLTLIPPDQETLPRQQSYANILAHELAHYWFGDLVTMAWWDDTWLNEALGEWLDVIITDAAMPSWRYSDERLERASWGMSADEADVAHPIRRPVDTREGIQASFDNAITYAKGSTVLSMFEAWVGPDRWQGFIRAYVHAHAWGNASAEQFIAAMGEALGVEVAAAFRTFLDQPGVPRVTATVTCAGGAGTIELTQQRSLPPEATMTTAQSWQLPVCVRWSDAHGKHGGRACTLLDGGAGAIATDACPARVLLNDGATGYYRSTYDGATARALLATPRRGDAYALAGIERRMVIADVAAAVALDRLPVTDALAMVPDLLADRDERVAVAGLSLMLIDNRVLDDADYARSHRWVRKVLGTLARKLGWSRGAHDSDDRHRLRRSVVAWTAYADDPTLVKQARALADTWLAQGTGVSDDMIGGVLGVAAWNGDAAFFDRLVAAAKATTDRRTQGRLIRALGDFRDPALAERARALVLVDDFDIRETRSIIYGQIYENATREAMWTWLQDHLDDVLGRLRMDEAAGLMASIAGAFCDADHRAAAAALLGPRAKTIDGAETALDQALEGVDQCIARAARQLPAIQRFLARY